MKGHSLTVTSSGYEVGSHPLRCEWIPPTKSHVTSPSPCSGLASWLMATPSTWGVRLRWHYMCDGHKQSSAFLSYTKVRL